MSARRSNPGSMPATAPVADEFLAHRGAMLRFARRRIRDDGLAEDAVQDALLSAIASRGSFQGQSALRTWLIGILNHKIQDTFRRESRYVSVPDLDDEPGMTHGARVAGPHSEDPQELVARRRLGQALAAEIDGLPPTLAAVFRMQVLDGAATTEVCDALGISESNCWVRLHRARKRLANRMSAHLS